MIGLPYQWSTYVVGDILTMIKVPINSSDENEILKQIRSGDVLFWRNESCGFLCRKNYCVSCEAIGYSGWED